MRKRVLIIVESLNLGGGAEKVASTLSIYLSKRYDVSISTFYYNKKSYKYFGKLYSLRECKVAIKYFMRPFKLISVIKSVKPDIIITFMNKTSFWVIPLKYIFRINIPLVISINTNPNFHYKKRIYGKFLLRYLLPLKKVNHLVPVSKDLKQIFVQTYKVNPNKITPIYNGIALEKIINLSKEEIDEYNDIFQNPDVLKFITMGRLSPEKGHKYLIKAFSNVKSEFSNSKLFLLGEGPLKTDLEKLSDTLGLKEDVIFLGFQENPYKFMYQSDIFVLSSLHEGLPYVLIEALACKLPIISTNCETGPKEILENGEYGLLVEVKDTADLYKKMLLLATDHNLRKNFSKKAEIKVLQFQMTNFITNWITLIEQLI